MNTLELSQTRQTGKAESFEYLYRDGDVARRRFWIVCWDEVTSMMLAWLLRKFHRWSSDMGQGKWSDGDASKWSKQQWAGNEGFMISQKEARVKACRDDNTPVEHS